MIRAVVGRSKLFVGKRIVVQTGTANIEVARRIRNEVVMKWIQEGSLVREIVLTNEGNSKA